MQTHVTTQYLFLRKQKYHRVLILEAGTPLTVHAQLRLQYWNIGSNPQ